MTEDLALPEPTDDLVIAALELHPPPRVESLGLDLPAGRAHRLSLVWLLGSMARVHDGRTIAARWPCDARGALLVDRIVDVELIVWRIPPVAWARMVALHDKWPMAQHDWIVASDSTAAVTSVRPAPSLALRAAATDHAVAHQIQRDLPALERALLGRTT